MRFKVSDLEVKTFNELRDLFATLPKTCIAIMIEGDFKNKTDNIAKALAYLPKTVGVVVFNIHYLYETVYYEVAIPNSNDGRREQTYKKSIGKGVNACVAQLPQSVETLRFMFEDRMLTHGQTTIFTDLAELVKSVPPHVRQLNLDNAILHKDVGFMINLIPQCFPEDDSTKASLVFKNIPNTVKTLAVGKLRLGKLPPARREEIASCFNPNITTLSLVHNELCRLGTESATGFFRKLPPNLILLNLGYNQLHRKTPEQLAAFFSAINLPALKQLRLVGNQLATFAPEGFIQALSCLPDNIEMLDLSENNFLTLELDSFGQIMAGLPQTITSLRLCEQGAVPKAEIASRFLLLPPHIKTLDCSYSDLLGLSVPDFIAVLSYLPKTVDGLCITANNLHTKTPNELIFLLSNLPAHIRRLKLNENGLSRFAPPVLKAIFSALSPQISDLDISSNGFNRLPPAKTQEILNAIPPTVKIMTARPNEFKLRNDGALVSANTRFFQLDSQKQEKRFINQQEFAKLRLIIQQMLKLMFQSGLPLELALNIFARVFEFATKDELENMFTAYTKLIISSVPPQIITPEHERECLAAVDERIAQRKPEEACLDLSRCGLNRLITPFRRGEFINKLRELPRCVVQLKLRGNGFLRNERSREVFLALMSRTPRKIHYLDLSDNEFEHQDAETLARLFESLPPRIEKVILDHEEALSPDIQVAKRVWPESYWELTEHNDNKLQQARALLDDYTKNDSAVWRFLYGHWNRSYTQEANRLVYCLDRGLIEDEEDLNEALENISPKNPVGALARRFCFLTHHQPRPQANTLNEENGENNATELQQLTPHGFQ